jgi:hypothetical protein
MEELNGIFGTLRYKDQEKTAFTWRVQYMFTIVPFWFEYYDREAFGQVTLSTKMEIMSAWKG